MYEWIEKFKSGQTSVDHLKHSTSPVKKKCKIQLSIGKFMLTIFSNSKRPIVEDYLKKGSRINSAKYCALLANNLKLAIHIKCGDLKARFHYDREKDYSLFVLLIFLLCLALASILSAERSIKETKKCYSTLVVETGLNVRESYAAA